MQVMMDEVGVFDGIDELNFAKTRLSGTDRKSTRLNSSHLNESRMPSSA